jgi:hypothetical protein
MIKKYNIALVPYHKDDYKIFHDAAHNFIIESGCAEHAGYFLKEDKIPHVSICHFNAFESEIQTIKNTANVLLNSNFKEAIKLSFPMIKLADGWCTLSVDKPNKVFNIKCLLMGTVIGNPLNESPPHLTLFNYRESLDYCPLVNHKIAAAEEIEFVMQVLDRDRHGQATVIL